MFRHTLRILQYLLQDFKSMSDHFETLCIKGLTSMGAAPMSLLSNLNRYFPTEIPRNMISKYDIAQSVTYNQVIEEDPITFRICYIIKITSQWTLNPKWAKVMLRALNFWVIIVISTAVCQKFGRNVQVW